MKEKKEINKYQIAKQLGIKPQSVYAWFSGKTLPTVENVVKLSQILEETIEETLKRFKTGDNSLAQKKKEV